MKKKRARISIAGQRVSLGVYPSEAEADAVIAAAREAVADVPVDGLTVAAWGEKVLTARDLAGTHRAVQTDRGRWKYVSGHGIGEMPLRALGARHIRAWLRELETRLSRQTCQHALNLLRVVLAEAVEAGKLRENPAASIDVRKRDARTEDAWTHLEPSQIDRLIAAAEGMPRAIIAFAIGTGLRAGELCALRLVDVTDQEVVVRYGTPPDLSTKGGKVRRVPVLPLAASALELAKATRPKDNPHGLVFPRPQGGFRDPDHVLRWDAWKAILDRAGLADGFRWHDLRHTFGTALASGFWGAPWPLHVLQRVMGHASMSTTERYAHVAQMAIRDAAKATQGGHSLATVTVSSEGTSAMISTSTPGATRTPDQRLRRPPHTAAISSSYMARVQGVATRYLVAVATDAADERRLGVELATAVLDLAAEDDAAAEVSA
jgi:integrase